MSAGPDVGEGGLAPDWMQGGPAGWGAPHPGVAGNDPTTKARA